MKYIIFISCFFLYSFGFSQTLISELTFSYDAAGNQTQRSYSERAPKTNKIDFSEELEFELITEEFFRVSPNPTYGKVIVSWSADKDFTVTKMMMSTLDGRGWEQSFNTEAQRAEIDLSYKESGFYILQIQLSNGEVVTKKIVKL